jgi:YHS domain-containing protein
MLVNEVRQFFEDIKANPMSIKPNEIRNSRNFYFLDCYSKNYGRCVELAKDPVCNMTVDEEKTELKSEYKDVTYYFCNPACKEKFDKNPEQYV